MNREDNKICNNKKLFASDLLEITLMPSALNIILKYIDYCKI